MVVFFRRFIGAMTLDPGAYEDIEHDRHAAMQSVLVVLLVCASAGVGAIGLGLVGAAGFVSGAILTLGGWLVWIAVIKAVGTMTFPEPDTHSTVPELLRTLGFASAPGVFLAFAAIREAAVFVGPIVAVWMLAASVLAMRQALDYHSTGRAIAVCFSSMLVALAALAGVAWLLSARVS